MKMNELKKMSLAELKSLRKKVDRAIESLEKRERKEALEALKSKAKELGYSFEELVGGAAENEPVKPATLKRKTPPKYRDPKNPSNTWSGRGRQPKWIKDAIAAGKSKDDFLI